MVKSLFKLLLILFFIIGLMLAGIAGLLHTPYASPWVIQIITKYVPQIHSIRSFEYQYPFQLSFDGIELQESDEQIVKIDNIDIWLSSDIYLDNQWQIDSTRLSGINLQHGLPTNLLGSVENAPIKLHQLAITAVDYASDELIIRDFSTQIKEPQFSQSKIETQDEIFVKGETQTSIGQLYWQGEAFDNVVIDADINLFEPESKIYGLSFDWKDATFSTQGEQTAQGWHLINSFVKNLHLKRNEVAQFQQHPAMSWLEKIIEVGSLDFSQLSIETSQGAITNARGSLQNIPIPLEIKAMDNAFIALEAESFTWNEQRWLEPLIEIEITDKAIYVDHFAALFEGGELIVKGKVLPELVHLDTASLNGAKWIIEEANQTNWLSGLLKRPLKIDHLTVKHSQIINLNAEPKWQVSGINVEGQNLELLKPVIGNHQPKLGLWNGNIHAAASTFNYGPLFSSRSWLSMQTLNGNWELTESFIPLENGLIEANARMNLNQTSQPWELNVESYGVPAAMVLDHLEMPLDWRGFADINIEANGLGGDLNMFNHSLNGRWHTEFRELNVTTPLLNATENIDLQISPVIANARRGVISIESAKISSDWLQGVVQGERDLVESNDNKLEVNINAECFSLKRDLLAQRTSLGMTCLN